MLSGFANSDPISAWLLRLGSTDDVSFAVESQRAMRFRRTTAISAHLTINVGARLAAIAALNNRQSMIRRRSPCPTWARL
jgi:hypothetical protein